MDQPTAAARRAPRPLRRRYSLWRLVRANLYDLALLLRDSYLALAGFSLVVLVGTLYLALHANLAIPQALYEALKVLTFQSGRPLPDDLAGIALFFLAPLLGVVLLAQSVLAFGRRLLDKGSRREAWQVALAATYSNHIIVCGLGRVGLRVASRLIESGYDVVAIERDWTQEHVARALSLKIPVVLGDAREYPTLRQAGVMRAHAAVAVINGDLLDIEIALAARALRPELPVVLRAFDEALDANLERVFGAHSAFSTSGLAAPTFAAAAVSHGIDHVLPPGDGHEQLGIARFIVREPHALATLEERQGVRVIAHQDRNGMRIPWSPAARLVRGETIELLGTLHALGAFRRMYGTGQVDEQAPAPPASETVILCGLGKVGYRVVRLLAARQPQVRIVVVHLGEDDDTFLRQVRALDGVEVVNGDARRIEVLRAAGLANATTVAALTSDDLVNLRIGLAARRERPDVHVVLRVFSDTLADKLAELFGIHTTYSTSELAAPTLAAAAVLGGITHGFSAAGALFSTVEMVLEPETRLSGRSVAAIRAQDRALVVGLCRAGEIRTLPAMNEVLAPGDRVTILAPLAALTALRQSARRVK